jgi:protein TonB
VHPLELSRKVRRSVRARRPDAQGKAVLPSAVVIEVTIGADGRVSDARVLRSIPLLDQAAVDAVRQCEFSITCLDGVPTPVVMTVTVQFALN